MDFSSQLLIFVISLVVYGVVILIRIQLSLRAIRYSTSLASPYSNKPKKPAHTFLVLGDSMILGAGLKDPIDTISGLLVKYFPNSWVETLAQNGAKVERLPRQLDMAIKPRYDLILIGIGGNDIVTFSSYVTLERQLKDFLRIASTRSNKIILVHSVNVGNIGLFLPPLSQFYDYRTRRLSRIYDRVARQFDNVHYVNFYRPRRSDHYTRATRPQFVADDGFHPNEYATRYFFEMIRTEVGLDEAFLGRPQA